MNISKAEQHMLHVLAQGGMIRHRRGETGHIVRRCASPATATFLRTPACRCSTGCGGAASSPRTAARRTASRRRGFAPCARNSIIAEKRGSAAPPPCFRSEEHTSELQSLMRISYAVLCLQKKKDRCSPLYAT